MKRLISSVLLIAMLAAMAVSCGNNNDTPKETISGIDHDSELPENQVLDLPALNYEDSDPFYVISHESLAHGKNDETAGAISRATYNQYAATADRLGVTFEFVDVLAYKDVPGMVTQSINAQSDDYQMVLTTAQHLVGLVNEGYFYHLSELPHINLDKIWWNKEYTESLSVDANDPYILFGDLSYNQLERTAAMFFNARLLDELHGMTPDDIYDLVLDGEWTIDKFSELALGVRQDDGNTQNDIGDIHGMTYRGSQHFDYFAYSAGLVFTTRDKNGYPVLDGVYTDKTVTLVDKLLAIFNSQDAFAPDGTDYVNVKFAGGKALFIPDRLYIASWGEMRSMNDDFGIVPMPKYDETIDGYHSVTGPLVAWGVVPTTVSDTEMVSAVIESLGYEGYHRVTPVYYEESLKLKYTRGDDVDKSSMMLDIIKDGARTDFLFINKLGNFGNIFQNCFNTKQNTIASAYAKYAQQAEMQLAALIEKGQNS